MTPPQPDRTPKFTPVYCSVCGRQVGKKPGGQVTLGLICDNPICNFQPEVTANQARDALIVAGALGGIPVSRIAATSGMSRQRVYQIFDTWKEGI